MKPFRAVLLLSLVLAAPTGRMAEGGARTEPVKPATDESKRLPDQLATDLVAARTEIARLRDELAAKTNSPAPTDLAEELRAQLNQAQALLTAQSAELAAARVEAGKFRAARETASAVSLESRLRQLEAEKSALAEKLAQTETAMSALATASANQAREEVGRATAAKKDAEDKLALTLRSFSVLEKERDELAAKIASAPTRPAAESAAPRPELGERLAAASAELESLRGRAAAAERDAQSAQAELARVKQALSVAQAAPSMPPPASAPAPEISSIPKPAPATAPVVFTPTITPPTRPPSSPLAASTPSATPTRPEPAPKIDSTRAATAEISAPVATPPAEPRLHTIVAGDTLSRISLKYYGTTTRWPEILAANRDILRDERSMIAGRVLRIP